jgi:hypothetical protein
MAKDESRGLMGALARTVAGADVDADIQVGVHGADGGPLDHQVSGRVTDAVPHEVRGAGGSPAVDHQVRGAEATAVPHEVRGAGDSAVAHRVDPVVLRVPPVVVSVAGDTLKSVFARIPADFTLRFRLFGREVATIELSGTASVHMEETDTHE